MSAAAAAVSGFKQAPAVRIELAIRLYSLRFWSFADAGMVVAKPLSQAARVEFGQRNARRSDQAVTGSEGLVSKESTYAETTTNRFLR
jgi:hypothetical protein